MAGTTFVYYKANSQYLQISGLKDQSTTPATYLNNATAVCTMYDASGNPVAGCSNVTGSYVASSNGVYRFPVDPATFDPAPGSKCTLKVDITSGTIKYHVEYNVKIAVRNTGLEI